MPATSQSPFLDVRAVAALAHMRFTTRKRIEGAYSGRHPSRQQGGAGEFVDYREYTEGEDLRRLDWKVLARSGRAYIRLYQDQTNLLCTLALDASASMLMGAGAARGGRKAIGSKLEYVQFLATALAQIIVDGQDQVGLALLGERLADWLPPAGTASHLARLHDTIERLQPSPTTRMAESLRELFTRVSRRGVLVVVSDFLMDDWEACFAALRLFRQRQWEVVTLHVVHRDEERLPEGTAFRFEGLEREGSIDCSPAEIRELYAARFAAHAAAVRTLALATGCDYRRADVASGYLQVVRSLLVPRFG